MFIVKLMGGLGNQMFQYALGRSLSLKYSKPIILDTRFLDDRTFKNIIFRNYDLDVFNLTSEMSIKSKDIKYAYKESDYRVIRKLTSLKRRFNKKYVIEKGFNFNPDVLEMQEGEYFDGYWQSYKYFTKFEDVLRKDFEFSHGLNDKEKLISEEIKSKNSICINVRRTDFVDNKETSQHHGVCGMDYFKKSIEIIHNKISKPYFYIFSDDLKWCNEEFSKLKIEYKLIDHQYAGFKFSSYLRLMAECKHFIIPNSSFAWWACWFNQSKDKIVITPKNWFNTDDIDTSDLIYPHWIRV